MKEYKEKKPLFVYDINDISLFLALSPPLKGLRHTTEYDISHADAAVGGKIGFQHSAGRPPPSLAMVMVASPCSDSLASARPISREL